MLVEAKKLIGGALIWISIESTKGVLAERNNIKNTVKAKKSWT